MRRFTCLPNVVAFYTVWYNLIRIHKTLRMIASNGRWHVCQALDNGDLVEVMEL